MPCGSPWQTCFGAKTGELDASSFGHPGKITFCFAEDPPPAPWLPLHVRLGYGADDTTVTVCPVEGVRQLAQQLNSDARGILTTFANSLKSPWSFHTGKGGQALMILGPEHAKFCIEQGWTQQAVAEFLCEQSRVSPEELTTAGVHLEVGAQHDMSAGPDGRITGIASPADIVLVTAGGEGAGWSAMAPGWAPTIHARIASRRVRPAGEALPDCGPDGCIVPWMR